MIFKLNAAKRLTGSAYAMAGIVVMLLTGCSSPEFVNPPPPSYLSPLPAAINGTWANETENGERVRVSGQKDGTVKLYFSETKPTSEPAPKEPLIAQTLHFDNADWILLDFRILAAWQKGDPYTETSPYRILKVVLEKPDRLCGIELGTEVFAEAVKSGKLEGKFVTPPPKTPMPTSVTITSPGEVWVKWWLALPAEQKKFGPTWCFVRVK